MISFKNFRLQYRDGNKIKTIKGNETGLYYLKENHTDNHLELKIITQKPVKLYGAYMDIDMDYSSTDKVFANGYQSWTVSREFTRNDVQNGINDIFGIHKAKKQYHMMGDYDFEKYSKRKGVFHSFSYTYILNNHKCTLFGSDSEENGYTVFYHDMQRKKLTVRRDLDGENANGEYTVFSFYMFSGSYDEVFDSYFYNLRTPKPRFKRLNGYTSWYNYYGEISEKLLLRDLDGLSTAGDRADIFQIDDGYQTAVGDWLSVDKKKFPNGVKRIADKIHEKGYKAGIWLAPFNAQKDSVVVSEHPEWFVKDSAGNFDEGAPCWGGAYTFDIYNEEAREYIKNIFNVILNEWGFDLVKLDFLYSVCRVPRNGKSRGRIMTEAMDFLRECVGEKMILGCGVPLFPSFGKVDFCRVSADIGTSFDTDKKAEHSTVEVPCTKSAITSTLFRRHLDGRAFLNDPDVSYFRGNSLLGEDEFAMPCGKLDFTDKQKESIAKINSMAGSVFFVSDNILGYNDRQRKKLIEAFDDLNGKILNVSCDAENAITVFYERNVAKFKLVINFEDGSCTEYRQ